MVSLKDYKKRIQTSPGGGGPPMGSAGMQIGSSGAPHLMHQGPEGNFGHLQGNREEYHQPGVYTTEALSGPAWNQGNHYSDNYNSYDSLKESNNGEIPWYKRILFSQHVRRDVRHYVDECKWKNSNKGRIHSKGMCLKMKRWRNANRSERERVNG